MNDLHDFKNMQIKALHNELSELREYITKLETFIFELTDESYPDDYKNIVRKELFSGKDEE
jgi:cell division protein FtsB